MADTRTIYLHTADTTFSSDPSDTGYKYLDMSDYDSLNPEYSSTVRLSGGVIGLYGDYSVKITLTFEGENSGRDERADWVNSYSQDINKISVATTPDKSKTFNKACAVSSIEMVDTNYLNGAQVIIAVTLFGRWQSALSYRPTLTETYIGGTKKYYQLLRTVEESSSALVNSAYVGLAKVGDETIPAEVTKPSNTYKYDYQYGSSTILNQLSLPIDKNRFIIAIEPNYLKGSIKLSNTKYTAEISSSNLSATNGISSDFITYSTGDFDNVSQFTLLQSGYVASTVWDNISDQYAVLYSIMNTINNDPANISVTNEVGQHIPFSLYVYSIQDFI